MAMPTRRARLAGLAAAMLLATVAACSGSSGSQSRPPATTSPGSSAPPGGPTLVVLGDSIPYGGHFCPGCRDFADSYAATLGQRSGRPYVVQNHSRDDSATLAMLQEQLASDPAVRSDLARAGVVLVSIGFNNTPAWPAGNPCGGRVIDDIDAQVATIVRYPATCVGPGVAVYRPAYDRVFTAIAALAPKSATLLAVNVYNTWLGNPGIRSDTSAATLTRLAQTTKRIYDAWNVMLCRSARRHGLTCVDIYHAFNGAGGRSAPDGLVQAQDYTHPSQAGNDLIAGLLAKVPLRAG